MDGLVEKLQHAQPTYADIGATLADTRPEGFHHDHYEIVLGHGAEGFEGAVIGLKSWESHRVPGVRVFPKEQVIHAGATVVVTLGTTLVVLAAPCRVVSVIDGQVQWGSPGFAYGTLPGHPEQGEEAFVVSISPEDSVRFEIHAFSRPVDPIVRLSGPIGRGFQRSGTHGYLRSLRRYVDQRTRPKG